MRPRVSRLREVTADEWRVAVMSTPDGAIKTLDHESANSPLVPHQRFAAITL